MQLLETIIGKMFERKQKETDIAIDKTFAINIYIHIYIMIRLYFNSSFSIPVEFDDVDHYLKMIQLSYLIMIHLDLYVQIHPIYYQQFLAIV